VPIGLAAAAAGAALAIALTGGGDEEPRQPASSTPRASQPARERTQTSTTAAAASAEPTHTTPQTTTPSASGAGPTTRGDPAALNDRGFRLIQSRDFADAVPLLRSSVEGYRSAGRTSELGYAYALFNLGLALAGSGDPAGAVEAFEERLRYPNQRGRVQKALREAQAQADGGENPKKSEQGTNRDTP
jgi:hypothetical protein